MIHLKTGILLCMQISCKKRADILNHRERESVKTYCPWKVNLSFKIAISANEVT